jgi:hypothetical protein
MQLNMVEAIAAKMLHVLNTLHVLNNIGEPDPIVGCTDRVAGELDCTDRKFD